MRMRIANWFISNGYRMSDNLSNIKKVLTSFTPTGRPNFKDGFCCAGHWDSGSWSSFAWLVTQDTYSRYIEAYPDLECITASVYFNLFGLKLVVYYV